MPARVPTKVILNCFDTLVTTNGGDILNFEFKDGTISMQVNGSCIMERTIRAEYTHDMEGISESFMMNHSTHLLNEEIETTIIDINKVQMVISQEDTYRLHFEKTHKELLDLDTMEFEEEGELLTDDLKRIFINSKKLDASVKVLKKGVQPVIVHDGKAFTIYSNTILIQNTQLPFNNMSLNTLITQKALRHFTSKVVKYKLNKVKKMLLITNGTTTSVVNYRDIDDSILDSILAKELSCKPINKFDLTTLVKSHKDIFKYYSKNSCVLSFNEDLTPTLSLQGFVNDNITIGTNTGRVIFSIQVSTAQMEAVRKVFTDRTMNVDILESGGVVCLRVEGLSLLISGLILEM